jgi:DNA-binding YbaB/EbfC family protein
MKNPLASMMQQAQRLQENYVKAQEELAELSIEGESGAGLVRISMNGKREVTSMQIDPSLLAEDQDMLTDLIMAAFNDGVHKVARVKQEKMAGVTGGFEMPAGLKLPF